MILLLIILVVLSIPYLVLGYLVAKSFRRKQKKNTTIYLVILLALIILPGFYFRLIPGSDLLWKPIDRIQERKYNQELTGFEFNDGKLIYKYESERAFNGDGYSIWIYKIDDKTSEYFKSPPDQFFTQHPSTKIRSHWKPEFWKRTPFDKKEQKFLNFAHCSLDELDFELEDLLNENGNYYSYEYYMHNFSEGTAYVGNIDFYIICPKRKLMVRINHNT